MPPRGLAEKKKDKKKKVNFKEVEKKKTYSTKVPVSDFHRALVISDFEYHFSVAVDRLEIPLSAIFINYQTFPRVLIQEFTNSFYHCEALNFVLITRVKTKAFRSESEAESQVGLQSFFCFFG